MHTAPHWTDGWEATGRALAGTPRLLLVCNFDGTLAPIVSHPGAADLSRGMRTVLRSLLGFGSVSLAILSGRSVSSIRQRVALRGISFCGNHGLEIEGPGFSWSSAVARAHRAELADAVWMLRRQMRSFRGVVVEDHGLSVAVDWRLVEESRREELCASMAQVVLSHAGLRLACSEATWELRPRVNSTIVTAIQKIQEQAALTSAETVYLGDEEIDETAYRALPGAVTLRVGASAPTEARFRAHDESDAQAFLYCLLSTRVADPHSSVPSPDSILDFMNQRNTHLPHGILRRERMLNLAEIRQIAKLQDLSALSGGPETAATPLPPREGAEEPERASPLPGKVAAKRRRRRASQTLVAATPCRVENPVASPIAT